MFALINLHSQIGYVESLCPAPPGGRPASIRSNSTFAASSAGFAPSGLQYGVPGSLYNSPAVSPPPTLTTPPALQNRNSYYGNALYATAPGMDLGPIRSRPQSTFVGRPVSTDASSLYSRRQSQSEISIRDPRSEYLPVPRPMERPHSYSPFQSSNDPINLTPDSRRMTYLGVGGHQYPSTTRSSLSLERPEGPIRMNSYASQVASVRSRDVDSPAMQSGPRVCLFRLGEIVLTPHDCSHRKIDSAQTTRASTSHLHLGPCHSSTRTPAGLSSLKQANLSSRVEAGRTHKLGRQANRQDGQLPNPKSSVCT
jgi:hypothetical protein